MMPLNLFGFPAVSFQETHFTLPVLNTKDVYCWVAVLKELAQCNGTTLDAMLTAPNSVVHLEMFMHSYPKV